jgi:hypothetical protein
MRHVFDVHPAFVDATIATWPDTRFTNIARSIFAFDINAVGHVKAG